MKTLYWTTVIAGVLTAGCRAEPRAHIGVVVSGSVETAARIAAEDYCEDGVIALRFSPVSGAQPVQEAVAAADHYADDPDIWIVVGHANSGASIAAARIYEPAGLPQLAPTTTAPAYSEVGENMFRLVPDDRVQARFLARIIQRDTGAFVVAYVNDDYGRALLAELGRALGAAPPSIAFSDNVDADDVAPLADHIISASPRRLVWLGRMYPLSELLPRLRQSIPGLQLIGSDGIDAPRLTTNTDGEYTGVRFVRMVDPTAPGEAIERVRTRLTTAGMATGGEALLVYDAVGLACQALADGARSRSAVRSYLNSLGHKREAFTGATGAVVFDSTHSVPREPYLGVITTAGSVTLPRDSIR